MKIPEDIRQDLVVIQWALSLVWIFFYTISHMDGVLTPWWGIPTALSAALLSTWSLVRFL